MHDDRRDALLLKLIDDGILQTGATHFSKRRKLLAGLGLAAVLVVAAAAAVRPALWALRFASARWRRIALLGYWVGLLVAALPLMDWVSRRRKVPTIIVRKVESPLQPGLCLLRPRSCLSWDHSPGLQECHCL